MCRARLPGAGTRFRPGGRGLLPLPASSAGTDSTPPRPTSAPRTGDHLARILRALPDPLLIALRDAPLPIWVVDPLGCIRWLNAAASERLGARLGAHFSRFVAPDGVGDARELFARKIHGRLDATVQRITLNGTVGPVNAELASVPIRDGDEVIGVITFICGQEERGEARRRRGKPRLTPRQHQVLELLAHGRSTREVAQALQISEATVRNHVRHILSELDVRTRLEAVVVAFRNGWLWLDEPVHAASDRLRIGRRGVWSLP